jgi:pimeloyl-ACP methyl ester carboxylesterase
MKRILTNWRRGAAVLAAALMLACGGGSEPVDSTPLEPPIAEPTGTGALVSAERLGVLTAQSFREGLSAPDSKTPRATPLYDVEAWRVLYRTIDVNGAVVEASGLLGLPIKPAGAASPVVSYQHGTTFKNAEVPSQHVEVTEPGLLLASMGYLTVSSDYVGYGATQGKPHPYLQAAPTAAAVVDLITAARVWRQRQGVRGNGQLFLLGYSEGGYATVAAHRAMQASQSVHLAQLVSVLPGAGPYHVEETLDGLLDRVRDDNPLIGGLLSPGLLKNLGSTVRNEVRRALVRALIPDDADVSFDTRFIDRYLADDSDAIERESNVHDWTPAVPVRFYHGRDDQTVPYSASTLTLATMQARGAQGVTLTDCPATPAGHLECVPTYFDFLQVQLGLLARDR